MEQSRIHLSAEDKLKKRLAMSYEERYKSAMKFIRLLHQLKSAKIIKPNEIVYMEDLENILSSKKNDPK